MKRHIFSCFFSVAFQGGRGGKSGQVTCVSTYWLCGVVHCKACVSQKATVKDATQVSNQACAFKGLVAFCDPGFESPKYLSEFSD